MRIRMRFVELLATLAVVVVATLLLLPSLSRAREGSRRASCQNNLKQMGLVACMFAHESPGHHFPPLSPVAGNWMMDMNAVYPDYLSDLNVLVCPTSSLATQDPFVLRHNIEHPDATLGEKHPDCVSSLFYVYTGYAITRDEEALALFHAYGTNTAPMISQQDIVLDVPVWESKEQPLPLLASKVPVMWDRLFPDESYNAHTPQGGNVLYMDGHVAFVRHSYYGGPDMFPMTRIAAETFGSTVPHLSEDCYSY